MVPMDFQAKKAPETTSPSPERSLSKPVDEPSPYRLLYFCSKCDKESVVQELERGVSPNLADHNKRTPLHLACCEGCTEIVEFLLEKGAETNPRDRWGHTPLADARSFGHKQICKILEARGATDLVESPSPCCLIDHKEVDVKEATLIGEGAYGEVYLVKWRGTKVAAKAIRSSIECNQSVKSIFMKELGIWQRVRHPNIVQYLGVLKNSDRLIFLTEYLPNGSLHDVMRKKGRLDLATTIAYALDIARGMNYLHQHKPHPIMHRDLKPRNILLDEAGHLKVADFGLSKIAQEKDAFVSYKMTGGTGSYRYMAPEVYRHEAYGKSVDVFSFALIVLEARTQQVLHLAEKGWSIRLFQYAMPTVWIVESWMLQGGPPNKTESPIVIADKRAYEDSRPWLSVFYPEALKTLLSACWDKDPEHRPSFGNIITQLEELQEILQKKEKHSNCYSCVIL